MTVNIIFFRSEFSVNIGMYGKTVLPQYFYAFLYLLLVLGEVLPKNGINQAKKYFIRSF